MVPTPACSGVSCVLMVWASFLENAVSTVNEVLRCRIQSANTPQSTMPTSLLLQSPLGLLVTLLQALRVARVDRIRCFPMGGVKIANRYAVMYQSCDI
jgi:hypothetical protein